MKLLLLLLFPLILAAKTIYILDTEDLYGKCSIGYDDIIIKPSSIPLKTPRGVKVIECNNKQCVKYEINRLKHLYRTKGISVITIK